jgi:hypothetical protein
VDGQLLWIANGSTLPKVCLHCGSKGGLPLALQLVDPKTRRWGFLFGAIGGAIAVAMADKVNARAWVCLPCHERLRKGRHAVLIGVLVWALVVGVAWVAHSGPGPGLLTAALFFGGLIGLVALTRMLPQNRLRPVQVLRDIASLSGVSDKALAKFEKRQRLDEQRAVQTAASP